MKKKLVTLIMVSVLTMALVACGNESNNTNTNADSNNINVENDSVKDNTEGSTVDQSENTETKETETTTTESATEDINTENTTEDTSEEPIVVYADWIDALYLQMTGLDFDSVIATISQSEFIANCSGYERGSVSTAYENQCYLLPVSSGDEIGVVKVGSEITVFICPNDTDGHKWHSNGFMEIGYGDIAVVYSEDGTVTCDGIHVKSSKRGQTSFDMESDGIWIIWSV